MSENTSELFAQLNKTELYQLCLKAEIQASASMSREELIARLLGALDSDAQNVMDSWRHGLAGFVLEHWTVLQNQIRCPLRSKDPRACFGCLDSQVIACLNDNEKHLHQIQLHRKWDKK